MLVKDKNNFGTNMKLWYGFVEDRDDPFAIGRARVRILGCHTSNKSLIPTDELPWSIPLMPVTSAMQSGVGESPVGLMVGSCVIGFWADGDDMQTPIIMGVLPKMEAIQGISRGQFGGEDTNTAIGDNIPTANQPQWLTTAKSSVGVVSRDKVLEYEETTDGGNADDDIQWASSFVKWCIKNSGVNTAKITNLSKSFLDWGTVIDEPRLGCIVVLESGGKPWSGHVGFWFGEKNGRTLILGANKNNTIDVTPYEMSAILGYRWV